MSTKYAGIIEVAHALIAEQGYIVLASNNIYIPGGIITIWGNGGDEDSRSRLPLLVIGPSTSAEFLVQSNLWEKLFPEDGCRPPLLLNYFYRVVAAD